MGPDKPIYVVNAPGQEPRQAVILEQRAEEVYVHYLHTDKRMDEWIPEANLESMQASASAAETTQGTKRRRSNSLEEPPQDNVPSPTPQPLPRSDTPIRASNSPRDKKDQLTESQSHTEDAEAVIEHAKITARRNFDKVIFGRWEMKTWYFSPYPLSDADETQVASLLVGQSGSASSRPVSRASMGEGEKDSPRRRDSSVAVSGQGVPTIRAHGRTADMLAAGLSGKHVSGESVTLWVCDRCFKYMRDGVSWELHMKKCDIKHPPGRRVYARGAHTIWEVDGAQQKLYCQNLALFGKLFIDIKTIFFDCESFFFYVFTDGDSQRDHVLGFFSKEKISYDDWNLACIITFPPYQKKGYGMLMIEFSYELSRRSGRLGTPERPLSDLGLRSYLAYWVATLVRFFRRILSIGRTEEPSSPGHARRSSLSKRKKVKGWHGELVDIADAPPEGPSASVVEAPTFGSIRTTHSQVHANGETTSHLNIRCTLMDIARATNLRHEDVAFALEECGMLNRRKREPKPSSSRATSRVGSMGPNGHFGQPENDQNKTRSNGSEGHGSSSTTEERMDEGMNDNSGEDLSGNEIIIVSREMVEDVAKARNVKQMCILHPAHVLL